MKDTTDLDHLEMPQGWYRIPERETEKTVPELPVGSRVRFKRYIARAGYRVQPTDIPVEELNKRAIAFIRKRYMEKPGDDGKIDLRLDLPEPEPDIDEETVKRVLLALDWMPRGSTKNCFSKDYRYHFFEDGIYPSLRWVYRAVRGQWFNEQKKGTLRTFWYEDIPEGQEFEGKIRERPLRQVGKYWPASTGSYYDPYDYDPAGLDVLVYQQVYRVYDLMRWERGIYWHNIRERSYLVHPLDAIEFQKGEQ